MYKQRDIVLIPMPYTDFSARKNRPALVISRDTYNEASTDIMVVMITATRNRMPYDIAIGADDMADGTLPKTSFVRADRIFSIAQKLIVKPFGSVTEAFHQSVCSAVGELISLPKENVL